MSQEVYYIRILRNSRLLHFNDCFFNYFKKKIFKNYVHMYGKFIIFLRKRQKLPKYYDIYYLVILVVLQLKTLSCFFFFFFNILKSNELFYFQSNRTCPICRGDAASFFNGMSPTASTASSSD